MTQQPPATTSVEPRITAPGLEALRGAIDRLDRATADLLVRRARMARRVALWKLLQSKPPRDVKRELQVRENYARILRGAGWSEQSLDSWLNTMLSASRDLQGHLTVAIQGAPGSWSEESLRALLPSVAVLHCNSVEEAWKAARTGLADAAWLAARNSGVGDVRDTSTARQEAESWAEVDHPIPHALLAPHGLAIEKVQRVEAHALALDQCRGTLDRLVPRAQRIPTIDGAHSARRLAAGAPTAVLASARLAPELGLAVLVDRATDAADNTTTFQLLLAKEIF